MTDNAIALFRDEYALPWIVLDRPSAACTIRRFTDLIARGKTSIEELVELMELPGLPITWPPLTQSQSPPKEPILLGSASRPRSRSADIVNQQTAPIMPRGLDLHSWACSSRQARIKSCLKGSDNDAAA